ncbi:MAG: hypothetical protein IKE42_24435 [Aquamicrobium sp.]|uniref:hypothetical protein n=1 Tax=Mesorhizobium sp. Pch-S TaxID=2082387 RepID=UPI0013EB72D5|nr:hypothetical protein [Mesorhizobium sp. Pch-S]MBR2691012.1 hypothetical protein [Aquamicrobium sp.]
MRAFTLVAMMTALVACDSGPTLQRGKGPVAQQAGADGLPVGTENTKETARPESALH